MKPNGLSAELDLWFTAHAKTLGKSAMALKREVLEEYRRVTQIQMSTLDNKPGVGYVVTVPVEVIDYASVGGDAQTLVQAE
jgi:hypothetical protein